MLRQDFIQLVHYRATGKPTAPTTGSKKYNQIVLSGQIFTQTWQQEPGVEWTSLFDYRNSGTITATDTFAIDPSIKRVSKQEGDYIRILRLDGSETDYQVVPADRLNEYKNDYAVAVVGSNLMFSSAFTSDSREFGGTIIIPSYADAVFPTDDVTDITVDDPYWLVAISAAEFVRNDITRKAEYPNLVGEAGVLMQKMKENNGMAVDELYRPNFLGITDSEAWYN